MNNLPELDLHGEIEDSVSYIINDFIKECLILKNYEFIIIHGHRGTIIKKKTKEVLSKHPSVKNYYISPHNIGQTIVELKD